MSENEGEIKLPAVGQFVQRFKQYILDKIKEGEYDIDDIERFAYLEMDIKFKTTRRYIREMEYVDLIYIDDNGILRIYKEE